VAECARLGRSIERSSAGFDYSDTIGSSGIAATETLALLGCGSAGLCLCGL